MKNLFKEAHKLTKEIKAEYPNVDYKAQFAICLSYLLSNGEGDYKVETITIKEIKEMVKEASKTKSIDEVNYWERGSVKRLYFNRYTGSGVRVSIGTIIIEEDGKMKVDLIKSYTNDVKEIFNQIENKIFKGEK